MVAESVADDSGFARFAANSIGPLAGWLTIAAAANLDSTLVETRGHLPRAVASRRSVALVTAASAAATAITVVTRGNSGYAAAAAWGLGGIVLRNQRESRPNVAAAAATGMCAVALATLLSRRYLRVGAAD